MKWPYVERRQVSTQMNKCWPQLANGDVILLIVTLILVPIDRHLSDQSLLLVIVEGVGRGSRVVERQAFS